MLTNCFVKVRNKVLFALLLFVFVLPVHSYAIPVDAMQSDAVEAVAADNEHETEEVLTVEKKKDKDKDKDKIQLNSTFYFSLLIDLAAIFLIIVFVYYPNYKKLDTIFTFILFNVVIFLLTFVLNKVKISMGAAFGLFAVFSMLRYRTAGIGMKDMTYLFIFIAIGLVSGIQLEFHELAIITGIIFLVTLLIDTNMILKKESSNILRYEKIEMVKPEKREELIAELRERTGLNIHRISINELDYLKDTVMITYYYYD
ncbi:MAG: DUF4956 domain-containing protein [Paludibacter sp.]|nr:DUF4956 domain-containing protein [Paludibacter sp.]